MPVEISRHFAGARLLLPPNAMLLSVAIGAEHKETRLVRSNRNVFIGFFI
jgi:hypothetical protein